MSNELMNTVTIGQASDLMEAVISDAFTRGVKPLNIMMHGSPGLGKSAITLELKNKISKRFDRPVHLIDLRLSAMESSDVQGIPYNAKTGRTITIDSYDEYNCRSVATVDEQDMFFSTPAWWPKDPNAYYILFLDELTNCPIHVQHAAYRLILDRSVQNGSVLPDNVSIVAAGNLKSDKTGARDLTPAAANRFAMHLVIDSENAADSFLNYAVNSGFDSSVVGFLNWKGSAVYSKPEDRQNDAAWASPRSWEFVNEHLKNPSIRNNPTMLRIAIAGAVGTSIATQYTGFLKFHDQLPDWKAIRQGTREYELPTGEDQLSFAVSTSLAFEMMDALEKDMGRDVNNLTKIVSQLPKELKIVFFKTLRRNLEVMMKFMNYENLSDEFQIVAKHLKR